MNQLLTAADDYNRPLFIYFLGALGTIVEWYDFAIYNYLTPVFAKVFFVNESHWVALILVYSIFLTSYLARPFGGLIYGYIGDYWGRKTALLLSIGVMSVTMFMIAVLPTWHTVGMLAPLLLVVLRIIQGISAGGETTGAIVYVLESVKHKHHGLFGSATWSITMAGVLIGSAVVAILMSTLSPGQMANWGWRIAYLVGVSFGSVVFIFRIFMPESVEFSRSQQEEQSLPLSPIREVFRHYKLTLLIGISLLALPGSSYAFIYYYFPQSIQDYKHIA